MQSQGLFNTKREDRDTDSPGACRVDSTCLAISGLLCPTSASVVLLIGCYDSKPRTPRGSTSPCHGPGMAVTPPALSPRRAPPFPGLSPGWWSQRRPRGSINLLVTAGGTLSPHHLPEGSLSLLATWDSTGAGCSGRWLCTKLCLHSLHRRESRGVRMSCPAPGHIAITLERLGPQLCFLCVSPLSLARWSPPSGSVSVSGPLNIETRPQNICIRQGQRGFVCAQGSRVIWFWGFLVWFSFFLALEIKLREHSAASLDHFISFYLNFLHFSVDSSS